MKNPDYSYGMRTVAGVYFVYLEYQVCGGILPVNQKEFIFCLYD